MNAARPWWYLLARVAYDICWAFAMVAALASVLLLDLEYAGLNARTRVVLVLLPLLVAAGLVNRHRRRREMRS